MARPAKALVNLQALRHNYQLAAELCAPGSTLAVVKANAYGHGAIEIAKALEPIVPAFGVACIEEAFRVARSRHQSAYFAFGRHLHCG